MEEENFTGTINLPVEEGNTWVHFKEGTKPRTKQVDYVYKAYASIVIEKVTNKEEGVKTYILPKIDLENTDEILYKERKLKELKDIFSGKKDDEYTEEDKYRLYKSLLGGKLIIRPAAFQLIFPNDVDSRKEWINIVVTGNAPVLFTNESFNLVVGKPCVSKVNLILPKGMRLYRITKIFRFEGLIQRNDWYLVAPTLIEMIETKVDGITDGYFGMFINRIEKDEDWRLTLRVDQTHYFDRKNNAIVDTLTEKKGFDV